MTLSSFRLKRFMLRFVHIDIIYMLRITLKKNPRIYQIFQLYTYIRDSIFAMYHATASKKKCLFYCSKFRLK